jgi:hypothetical protein
VSAIADAPLRVMTGAARATSEERAALGWVTIGACGCAVFVDFLTVLAGLDAALVDGVDDEVDRPDPVLGAAEDWWPTDALAAAELTSEELDPAPVADEEPAPALGADVPAVLGCSAAVAAPLTPVTTHTPVASTLTRAMARGRRERRTIRSNAAATRDTCMRPLETVRGISGQPGFCPVPVRELRVGSGVSLRETLPNYRYARLPIVTGLAVGVPEEARGTPECPDPGHPAGEVTMEGCPGRSAGWRAPATPCPPRP